VELQNCITTGVENVNFYILPNTEFRAKTFRYELAERSLSQIY